MKTKRIFLVCVAVVLGWHSASYAQAKPAVSSPKRSIPLANLQTGTCQVSAVLGEFKPGLSEVRQAELKELVKLSLSNPNCHPCVSKEKYINALYGANQPAKNWPAEATVSAKEKSLTEAGMMSKQIQLYAESSCVFHRDYGFTPDALDTQRLATGGSGSGGGGGGGSGSAALDASALSTRVDPINVTGIESSYGRALSPTK